MVATAFLHLKKAIIGGSRRIGIFGAGISLITILSAL
jgi:hypothetical protein